MTPEATSLGHKHFDVIKCNAGPTVLDDEDPKCLPSKCQREERKGVTYKVFSYSTTLLLTGHCKYSTFPDASSTTKMGNYNQTCVVNDAIAYVTLTVLYTTVLVGGTIGIIIMTLLLYRTNTRSLTTTVVINLLVVHSIFLLTVPFRIIYYVDRQWYFGFKFCKIISAMIHIHTYLSFIFYVAMLIIRYISYFKQKDKIEFYRKLHSVVASAAVWIIIILVIFPLFYVRYGWSSDDNSTGQCFRFHTALRNPAVINLNYVLVVVVVSVICLLLVVQIFIIVRVVKKLRKSALDHQEFWAQLKSLFFILVMIICFIPYHMFRIYFIHHANECYFYNEIFLGITALSCLDLLSFAVQTYFQKVLKHMPCTLTCIC
ncbi:PREDICTED: probable G-protein coupled receptor 141 [Nanorana parkeri]|uniref:probable G-protein coupled receptor 141 n=1 Tax=Nanorana parkeri TaxID=125878 RepID=UPI0008540C2D|nr:PREDICTED: probable G-protein coupled receptor 141 [Nanorana parkeri]